MNLKTITSKNKDLVLFRAAVKDYISNSLNYIDTQKDLTVEFETHNAFGEAKRRLKIRKKGKMGSRAHLLKKTAKIPEEILEEFSNEISEKFSAFLLNFKFNANPEKKMLENWLQLDAPKAYLNLKKSIFINHFAKNSSILEVLHREKQEYIDIAKELRKILKSFFKGEKFLLDELKAQKLVKTVLNIYLAKFKIAKKRY